MNGMQLKGGLASCLAVSLVLAGCSDSDSSDTGPQTDAIVDTGTPPVDTGVDPVDAGFEDTGIPPDTGFPDAGFLPTEGENCTAQGECADPFTCVNFGDVFTVCLNVCQQDAECQGSTLTPEATICANETRLQNGNGDQFGWCVQELRGEGELILDPPNPSVPVDGNLLTACEDDTGAFGLADNDDFLRCVLTCETDDQCTGSVLTPPASTCAGGFCAQETVGEGELASVTETAIQGCTPPLFSFASSEPGAVSCGRICADATECTTPGIEFCNENIDSFDNPEITGVCTRRAGVAGEPCSDRNIVDGCTLNQRGQTLFCVDFWGQIGDDEELEGYCQQYCGNLDGVALTPDEVCSTPPTRPDDPAPTCVLTLDDGTTPVFDGFPDVGFCSDECTNEPNSCGGDDPVSCFENQELANFTITASYCVTPVEPTLPVWFRDLGGVPPEYDCSDRFNRCPGDAYCISVGGGSNAAVCVYGCNAEAPVGETGCEDLLVGTSSTACNPIVAGEPAGICEPL